MKAQTIIKYQNTLGLSDNLIVDSKNKRQRALKWEKYNLALPFRTLKLGLVKLPGWKKISHTPPLWMHSYSVLQEINTFPKPPGKLWYFSICFFKTSQRKSGFWWWWGFLFENVSDSPRSKSTFPKSWVKVSRASGIPWWFYLVLGPRASHPKIWLNVVLIALN